MRRIAWAWTCSLSDFVWVALEVFRGRLQPFKRWFVTNQNVSVTRNLALVGSVVFSDVIRGCTSVTQFTRIRHIAIINRRVSHIWGSHIYTLILDLVNMATISPTSITVLCLMNSSYLARSRMFLFTTHRESMVYVMHSFVLNSFLYVTLLIKFT